MFQNLQLTLFLRSKQGAVGAVRSGLQLSHILVSQKGAVGGVHSGLGRPKVCNCHTFRCPRRVLLEVVDLALHAPKCATVTHFALPEVLLEAVDLALDCLVYTSDAADE